MSSKTGDVTVFVALGLAAAAAVMSARYQIGDMQQKLLSLLVSVGAVEVAATSGAVGKSPQFPVSP
jgi:hypothetical protein